MTDPPAGDPTTAFEGRGLRSQSDRLSSDPADLQVVRLAALEKELKATATELLEAIRRLEGQGDKGADSRISRLLRGTHERLAGLRDHVKALKAQQGASFNDLRNVLTSTGIGTLFLDRDLRIRFLTPSIEALFDVGQGDIGRALSDLSSWATGDQFTTDARAALLGHDPMEREVEAPGGLWFIRRISTYRGDQKEVGGVVITFTDVTDQRRTSKALELAKQRSELANRAKSRFVAAASHDLRQPLQTLTLLHGLLEGATEGDRARKLVARFGQTLDAMSGLLNILLDINQIEVGIVKPEISTFALDDLLDRVRGEFTYHAKARSLALRVLSCGATIQSDGRLLEQIIRNLISNALKYTNEGKVLVGCRRRGQMLSIEVWDTGIGIPHDELEAIFEEYHQVDNVSRARSRGLGLGLSIVQRLADLLGHKVRVSSRRGRGSVFAIEVDLPDQGAPRSHEPRLETIDEEAGTRARHTGSVLVVEDDPELRDLLEVFLIGEGYHTVTAGDGVAAVELGIRRAARPDLIIADYNLPKELNGLQLATRFREMFEREIPVIILTGDISTETLREVAFQHCVHLSKPVRLKEMRATIERLMSQVAARSRFSVSPTEPSPAVSTVFIVDDDMNVCEALREMCEDLGRNASVYPSSEAFLAAYPGEREGCVLIDAYLPGMSGIELLQRLRASGDSLPAIMITGSSDVRMAVQAMKAGATDFIEKPIGRNDLLASIERALEQSRDRAKVFALRENATKLVARLTPRQREIMHLVLAGHPSKNIAADLGISQRTVENHRAAIMKKTGSRSLPELARLALAADGEQMSL
ncbi:response regulator [uncultured Enterovirga sp.]|uniref:response regulator n=1 Tax=uncultured Enterovirga sp. TaxID=2026352 RepID=UPI0035CBA7BB